MCTDTEAQLHVGGGQCFDSQGVSLDGACSVLSVWQTISCTCKCSCELSLCALRLPSMRQVAFAEWQHSCFRHLSCTCRHGVALHGLRLRPPNVVVASPGSKLPAVKQCC